MSGSASCYPPTREEHVSSVVVKINNLIIIGEESKKSSK